MAGCSSDAHFQLGRTQPTSELPLGITALHLLQSSRTHHSLAVNESYRQAPYPVDFLFRRRRSCRTQLLTTSLDFASSLNRHTQTDVAIVDVSKTFDRVAYHRLVQSQYYNLITGLTSSEVPISGVPQRTVLGNLLFLLFIKDISHSITTKIRLAALTRNQDRSRWQITTRRPEQVAPVEQDLADGRSLQDGLNQLHQWNKIWQMADHYKTA